MRRKLSIIAVISVMVLVLSAQVTFSQEQGSKEIGFDLSIMHQNTTVELDSGDEDATNTMYSGRALLGYFLTDQLEIGASFQLVGNTTELGDSETTMTMYMPGVLVRYLFGEGRMRPFVGLNANYVGIKTEFDGDDGPEITGYGIGGQLGLKYFVTEKTALNVEYDPSYISLTVDMDDDEVDSTGIGGTFLFGISVFF